ncbi:unnamed protein product [Zymoseptoria tritici ST99CH_1E4]|uniref:Cytochrome b561 domain-containing protein n=1 Tax=Zymoseptoria tritici ST99CH_1E4 TaxID=1276532 RepID=A0A2H1FQ84_ZYMTR|nr:unnamed protein product [Zymoseptoria tritici ST99CH_1E4]
MKPTMPALILAFFLATTWAASPQETHDAGIDEQAKAAYFVLPSSGYVFALNVAENGDVYYHMNAPASHSWMGVGFGSSMTNTRMLISYLAEDGHHLTNTVRYSTGHTEPVAEDVVIEPVTSDHYAPFSNTLSPDGIMIAHAVCRKCATWKNGALNLTNTAEQFVFALGPNITLHSNDKNAPLRLHDFHGTFQLDMTVATNYTGDYARVPAPQDPGLQTGDSFWAFANYYSSSAYNTSNDAEWAGVAHAVFMCFTFLLIFPLGALSLRLLRRALVHAAAQVLGVIFLTIGLGLGIYASKLYNKSKTFTTPHQILGLIIFASVFIQLGLGLTHHILYLRAGTPTIMGKIHRYLGISITLLGIANGFLGLDFAGDKLTPYGIVVAVMLLIFALLTYLVFRHNNKHVYRPEKQAFIPNEDGEAGREYELRETPFSSNSRRYIQTPRTPFFSLARQKWNDRSEDKRAERRGNQMAANSAAKVQAESLYADTPASERTNPFKGKWEAVPLR